MATRRITLIEDAGRLAALAPEWTDLLRASAADSAFLTFEWASTWWRHFEAGRRLRVITVHVDDELIAIAPLVLCPRRRAPLRVVPALEFLGSAEVGADYLDIIVRRGREADACEALGGALAGTGQMMDLAALLPESYVTAHLQRALARRGWLDALAPADICPFIILAGRTWEDYLSSLGSQHRYNFRRRLRNLSRQFDLRFECIGAEARRGDALAALIRLHNSRWDGRGGSAAFGTPAQVAFHDEVTRLFLARGWLRLYVLWLDGTIAAALYGFVYNRKFYFYQSGFNSEFRQHSVGLVTMGLTIEQAVGEGVEEFDLLRGTEPYKFLWARESRQLSHLEVTPPNLAGLVHRASIRARSVVRRVVRGSRPAAALPAFGAASGDPEPAIVPGGNLRVPNGKIGTGL
jgi:CelD/BcsL family acetyltransferase involved in cellulose biosynthesis